MRQWLRALRGKPGRLLLGHSDAELQMADGQVAIVDGGLLGA